MFTNNLPGPAQTPTQLMVMINLRGWGYVWVPSPEVGKTQLMFTEQLAQPDVWQLMVTTNLLDPVP